jgi:hypothetical protein
VNTPEITIEELAKINPGFLEDPVDWSPEKSCATTESFQSTVESVLGKVRWNGSGGGASTSYGGCAVPVQVKITSENEFVGINLSKFSRLFTVIYAWDMKPEYLTKLVDALASAGFRYVPFTLFVDPANYHWEYETTFMKTGKPPPKGKNEIQHEAIWRSLFDYL